MKKLWFILTIMAFVVLGAIASEQMQCIKANDQGEIVLEREARVADAILPPGKYLLHSETADGKHYVHFVEETKQYEVWVEGAFEQTLSTHVAEAKCDTEKTVTKASLTAIYLIEEPTGMRIKKAEIRGENHVHLL